MTAAPKRNIRYSFLIIGLCVIVLSSLFYIGFLSPIQQRVSDDLYGGGIPLDNIAIVAVDDKSLQSIGRWPWDRRVFADLIDNLSSAKTIGFDVAFFETSTNESDRALAESIGRAGNVVVPIEFTSFSFENGKAVGKDLLVAIPEIREQAQEGYVNIQTDSDGVTRSVNLAVSDEYTSFTSSVLSSYLNGMVIPSDSRFLINFAGPPGSFKTYSAVDVLNGEVFLDTFDNKLVFIGATSPDLHDDQFVPTSEGTPMPGVEVHANIIQTLITKKYLNEQPTWSVILAIFLTCLVIFLLLQRFSIKVVGGISLGLIVFYLFACIRAFDYGIIMNLVYVPVSAVLSYSSLVSYYYVSEKRAKEYISTAFSKFVSKDVVAQLIEDPSKLQLGGVTRQVTIFFSDIRGFTGISQHMSAEDLVKFLNGYLTEMTTIILSSNGTVDKYMGDAIMAFWNAPLDQEDHPYRAAQSSLDQIKRLKELQIEWKSQGLPPMDIGIGLHTGEAVVGNVGSKERYDYTAMGDTINLGSRLEGVNKQYGTNIIISDATNEIIKDKYLTRMIDRIEVKGRSIPLDIYELLNSLSDASTDQTVYARMFEEGMNMYFDRDWDGVIKYFKDLQKRYNSKIPSAYKSCKLFIDRASNFKKDPPAKDWDGVYKMTTK